MSLALPLGPPRTSRRWIGIGLPVGLLVLLSGFLVLTLVAALAPSEQGDSGTTDAGACTMGGAAVAANVSATFHGARLRADQVANAQTIVAVGRQKKIPAYGWVVAIAAAMQESTLTNLDHGDRDSVGLFQMRPSMGWGSVAQLTDPEYAASKFYDVLQTHPTWQSMSVTQAAQAVEQSGFPDAYAAHERDARALVSDPVVLGASCAPAVAGPASGTDVQRRVVAAAMAQLGVPYSWGGGDFHGKTYGIERGAATLGFDCSGLTGYAWYQGSGGKVAMDTYTGSQMDATVPVAAKDVQPGDLFFFPGHVGMYDGRGGMIQAPHTGAFVEVTPDILSNRYWMGRLLYIGRPKAFLASRGA